MQLEDYRQPTAVSKGVSNGAFSSILQIVLAVQAFPSFFNAASLVLRYSVSCSGTQSRVRAADRRELARTAVIPISILKSRVRGLVHNDNREPISAYQSV